MSNVTQLTKVKTGLYALITFLFLLIAPVQACESIDEYLVIENRMFENKVSIDQKIEKDGKTYVVFKHKDYPEHSKVIWFENGCAVDGVMLPTKELKEFLGNST